MRKSEDNCSLLRDYGNNPFITNINYMEMKNTNFRTALWTGDHLQVTLMCIKPGDDIGLECHPHFDQFIKIESGNALVKMGNDKNNLTCCEKVDCNYAVIIPAGTWHNIINTGNTTLKLFSVYAPPAHPHGTVHKTKDCACEE